MEVRKQDYIKPRDGEVAIPTISFSTPVTLITVDERGKVLSSWIKQSSKGDRKLKIKIQINI